MKRLLALASILTSLLARRPRRSQPSSSELTFATSGPWTRRVEGRSSSSPTELLSHSHVGFADLRVLDARGEQVAWRLAPHEPGLQQRRVPVLNSGRQGRYAVALLDLGAQRRVRDRAVLDIPERGFVGRAVVLGADRRRGTVYAALEDRDLRHSGAAEPARSTLAVFPPSDFRYLEAPRKRGQPHPRRNRVGGGGAAAAPRSGAPVCIAGGARVTQHRHPRLRVSPTASRRAPNRGGGRAL